MTRVLGWGVLFTAVLISVGACSEDAFVGFDRPAASAGGKTSDGPSDASTPLDARASACQIAKCGSHVYACGDCVDNDGDGLVDSEDPDCVGPCQNSEDTFFGSIPGQNHQPCAEDCYFDSNSGVGNDDCVWSHTCDPLEVAPSYSPEGATCAYDATAMLKKGLDCATALTTQSAACTSVCGPLTPNGCDCFGCCAVPGTNTAVWLGSTDDQGAPSCDHSHLDDPTRCKPCTLVQGCSNPCDTCELCFGKRTLPASCAGSTACSPPSCPAGVTPCGASCLPDCPTGEACVTGCCVAVPG